MRTTSILVLTLLYSPVALAQPGAVEPGEEAPPQPVYAPPPQPQYYAQPVQLELTEEQQDLLARGEISKGKWIAGGIVAYVVGFGVGHAIQDRYSDRGWIFTVGEVGSLASIVYGVSRLTRDIEGNWERGSGYIVGGIIGMLGFRIWEVVDAWVAPPIHNKQVRGLRRSLGLGPQLTLEGFYVAPPQAQGSGGVAGLSLSF